MSKADKILVQCDFDGTIALEDASFMILDAFTGDSWRQLFKDYQEGKITVGRFNADAFSRVRADRESLLEVIREKVNIRPGFSELLACCRRKGFRFVIVSNGLTLYIDQILRNNGITGIEVFAAETEFHPEGLRVRHKGPDGSYLDADVKASFIDYFLSEGYRIVYIGDGSSDVAPATKSQYVFAIDSLLENCRKKNIECTPFSDFHQVVEVMERW